MGFVHEVLFESPVILYMTLALAAMVSLAIWHKTRAPQPLWVLAACGGLAGAVALTDGLVETDREQLEAVFDELRQGAADNDVNRIMTVVSDGFSVPGITKATLRERLLALSRFVDFRSIDLNSFVIERVEQDRARAILTVIYTPNKYYLQWRLTFALDPDERWRIQSVGSADHSGLDLKDAMSLIPADRKGAAKRPVTPQKSATP